MRYVSLFSGIEAASVAWEPLGWEPVAFAEIEPFCCELLSTRFPSVPNLGDVSDIDWSELRGSVELVVGGSPCQAFSVAGKRQGLLDDRGKLMLEYIRAIRDLSPRWMLWENVPGVLSQSDGDAFETFQRELDDIGYALAWRVIDAQFCGVAQRRRRVFVVGHHRVGCASAVLFERESLQWDHQSSKAKRQSLAKDAQGRSRVLPFDSANVTNREDRSNPQWGDPCHTLTVGGDAPAVVSTCYAIKTAQTGANGSNVSEDVAFTLDCAGPLAVAFAQNTRDEVRIVNGDGAIAGALAAQPGAKQQTYIYDGYVVRRLTPTECERLQGFPDGWTDLGGTPDAPRYRALGNSMAVPVMRWIGERIQLVDSTTHGAGSL